MVHLHVTHCCVIERAKRIYCEFILKRGWCGDGAIDSTCSRGHPRICSLGGVGYLGSVTTHLAEAAQRQQKAMVYTTCWKIRTLCGVIYVLGLIHTVQSFCSSSSRLLTCSLFLMQWNNTFAQFWSPMSAMFGTSGIKTTHLFSWNYPPVPLKVYFFV